MAKTIELDEADESLARYVREVETGEEYVIIRDGKPVDGSCPCAGLDLWIATCYIGAAGRRV